MAEPAAFQGADGRPRAHPRPATQAHRYAVYFAPNPGSRAWLTGSHWLGRCAALLQPLPQPAIEGISPQTLHELTAAPRRYGWHATLKAPFELAPGADWLALHQAVQTLAQSLRAFMLPPLQVQLVDGDFLALVPATWAPGHPGLAQLQAAAAACVTQLDPLAAPLDAGERKRRRQGGLTPRQQALLERWGYPFVLDEFRFHLSLTGSLAGVDAETRMRLTEAAQEFFAEVPPLRFDSLALFAEPSPAADFVLLDHLELGG